MDCGWQIANVYDRHERTHHHRRNSKKQPHNCEIYLRRSTTSLCKVINLKQTLVLADLLTYNSGSERFLAYSWRIFTVSFYHAECPAANKTQSARTQYSWHCSMKPNEYCAWQLHRRCPLDKPEMSTFAMRLKLPKAPRGSIFNDEDTVEENFESNNSYHLRWDAPCRIWSRTKSPLPLRTPWTMSSNLRISVCPVACKPSFITTGNTSCWTWSVETYSARHSIFTFRNPSKSEIP